MKKKIVILGAGESGTGSAILAKKRASKYLFPTRGRSNISTKKCLKRQRSGLKKEITANMKS